MLEVLDKKMDDTDKENSYNNCSKLGRLYTLLFNPFQPRWHGGDDF